jgi:multicomponent Na+:H+ antiporter subunit B
MSTRLRLALFAVAQLCLLPAIWKIARALPPFGNPIEIYGRSIDTLGPPLRHISNMVSAVNFDFRGLDTVGEEFMLLCAVTGAVTLLRGIRGEDRGAKAERLPGRPLLDRAESTILVARVFAPLILLFGLYMVLHATVTPGGGFQGGVIIASGLLLVYLGEGYDAWRCLAPSRVFDAMEGGGSLLFLLCGLGPMAAGGVFMENLLPLGSIKDVFSGGLIVIENASVAIAVIGGFAMLFLEFMEETRAAETEDER